MASRKKVSKPTFAKVLLELERAGANYSAITNRLRAINEAAQSKLEAVRARSDLTRVDAIGKRLDKNKEAALTKLAAARAKFEAIRERLNEIKATELGKYPQHFTKSPQEKARLLLLGWMEGGPGPKQVSRHFPELGSFLDYECRWAIAELQRKRDGPTCRLVASLFVPDDNHPLAENSLTARLVRRRAGASEIPYTREQIVSAVKTFERDGLGTEDAVNKVADSYDITREYIYRARREAETETLRYSCEQIVSAIKAFEQEGLGREAAITKVSDLYDLIRKDIDRCLKQNQ